MDSQTNSADETRSDLRKAASWIGTLIIALPVLYILSTGPVIKLAEGGVISGSMVEAIYGPVMTLSDHSEVFKKVLYWYVIDVWRVK